MRITNPNRPVIVVSKATLDLFLDPEDYPLFHGVHGTPDDFSCSQYLSDWVRLILLEKYGGVWLDAAVICSNAVYVDSWVSSAPSQISTMFPTMHANSSVHGNWAMTVSSRGHHPLIRAWRKELAAVCDRTLPGKVPVEYIDRAFDEHPSLVELRINAPIPQPLPNLWTYLELQVVLQKQPTLSQKIHLSPGIDGPMYRRYRYDIEESITDNTALSQATTADDLATQPLSLDNTIGGSSRWLEAIVAPCRCISREAPFDLVVPSKR
jgi:hypothetical protein